MSDRAFGVELEFNSGNYGYEEVAKSLRNNKIGCFWYGEDNYYHDENNYNDWILEEDGSEFELKSPILRGESGFQELKVVMTTLSRFCSVTRSDGFHVHHDAPEFKQDLNLVKLLVKSWIQNQESIKLFSAPYRHGNYWACPEWTPGMLEVLEKQSEPRELEYLRYLDDYGNLRFFDRNNLNIMSLVKHGTIEIRQHEGTLNYETAESWIRFGQKFLDSCVNRKNPIPDVEGAEDLLKRIRVTNRVNKFLTHKAESLQRRGY